MPFVRFNGQKLILEDLGNCLRVLFGDFGFWRHRFPHLETDGTARVACLAPHFDNAVPFRARKDLSFAHFLGVIFLVIGFPFGSEKTPNKAHPFMRRQKKQQLLAIG